MIFDILLPPFIPRLAAQVKQIGRLTKHEVSGNHSVLSISLLDGDSDSSFVIDTLGIDDQSLSSLVHFNHGILLGKWWLIEGASIHLPSTLRTQYSLGGGRGQELFFEIADAE